jgi:hypothetical protein
MKATFLRNVVFAFGGTLRYRLVLMVSRHGMAVGYERAAHLYKGCMQEVKFRLTHSERLLTAKHRHSADKVLIAENVALQYRKTIELIALASIAANEQEYSRLRARFQRDWNARLIFRDVERINSKFYPIPIEGLSEPKSKGEPSVIEEYDCGFLDRQGAIDLYEKCSAVLHAENPFGGARAYGELLTHFRDSLPLLKTLLGNFWVYLVPPDRAFCVWLYFGESRDIDIALFSFA